MKIRHLRGLSLFSRSVLGLLLSGGLAIAIFTATPDMAVASSSSSLGQAKKALLVASDLPAGGPRRGHPATTHRSQEDQLAQCLGIPTSIITDNPPTVNSPEFDSKNQLQSVNDSVEVYPSAKAAKADHASLSNPKTPACLTQGLNGAARSDLESQFGSGASLGKILVSRSPASEFAPGSANFTAFLPVTTHGVTLNLELTVDDYVKGRTEQTVVFTSVQSPFPSSLAKHVTTAALGRL